jgi:hypothetical protein
MIKHYIIAGNHNEFINWKKKPEIQAIAFLEDTVHQFVYVSSVDSLRGIHEPHGKLIGTWYNRPYHPIYQCMLIYNLAAIIILLLASWYCYKNNDTLFLVISLLAALVYAITIGITFL